MGLGLFVTRQIVKRYGGAIRVESQSGEGSLFIIQLPRTTAEGETPRASAEKPKEGTILVNKGA